VNASRYAERRANAVAAVERQGLEGLLVAPGPDLAYLTGHSPPPLERLTMLVLAAGRDPLLVVPALERLLAEAAPGSEGLDIVDWGDARDDPYAIVAGAIGAGRYAITDHTWASHLLALQRTSTERTFVSTGEAIPLLRAVKDPEEIERLRAAGSAADAVFAEVLAIGFEGRAEREVATALARMLQEHGHQRAEFTIVGSGPNAASSHHDSGDRRIAAGDAVVMDFGGVMNQYCSDITRTVFVGEPTAEQRQVYDVVRAAQQAAFEAVRPGVQAQEVDRAARGVIAAAGYGERFVHRTGHGIGLEVHEAPYIVEGDATALEPGMAFSDEPGIYLEGRFGVRIEDQVVVTADGGERLNEATRDLTIVA
jgi:D-alanyl-D-alanine dipeptidase